MTESADFRAICLWNIVCSVVNRMCHFLLQHERHPANSHAMFSSSNSTWICMRVWRLSNWFRCYVSVLINVIHYVITKCFDLRWCCWCCWWLLFLYVVDCSMDVFWNFSCVRYVQIWWRFERFFPNEYSRITSLLCLPKQFLQLATINWFRYGDLVWYFCCGHSYSSYVVITPIFPRCARQDIRLESASNSFQPSGLWSTRCTPDPISYAHAPTKHVPSFLVRRATDNHSPVSHTHATQTDLDHNGILCSDFFRVRRMVDMS